MSAADPAPTEKRKNILFLMTDQQRWDHIGFHPESVLATPNLDRLAESVGFTDCQTPSPLCTPARCASLTGRYAHQVNMRTMSGELDPDYPTYPKALQAAGYHTACIGKTHWWQGWSWFDQRPEAHYDTRGLQEELKRYGWDTVWECTDKRAIGLNPNDYTNYLNARGHGDDFRQFYASISGSTFKIGDTVNEKTGVIPFPEEDMAEAVVTRKIFESIDASRDSGKPFCIFGSWFGPHEPYDCPQRFLDQVPYEAVDDFVQRPGDPPLSEEAKKQLWKCRQGYKALVLMIDEQVRLILEGLEKRGLLGDTVILFTSDHGDLLGDHRHTQKGMPFKQSAAVPCAIRHPDHLNRIINHSPVEMTDLTATLLDAAGLDPQEALGEAWPSYRDAIPCRSLMPIIRGEADRVRDFAFSECDMKWHDAEGYQPYSWQMIVDEDWKYIRYLDRKVSEPGQQRTEWLIHRPTDPTETRNVADEPDNATVLNRMRTRLDWINDTTPTAQTSWIPFKKRQAGTTA
ncbi:MAG: sulfatase family protein [Opitutales bacterium]